MKESLPKPLQAFIEKYPEIWNAYEKLGHECHVAGPLDEKTRRLIKLGIAVGARLEGAVRSHTKRAVVGGSIRRRNSSRRSTCHYHDRIPIKHRSYNLDYGHT